MFIRNGHVRIAVLLGFLAGVLYVGNKLKLNKIHPISHRMFQKTRLLTQSVNDINQLEEPMPEPPVDLPSGLPDGENPDPWEEEGTNKGEGPKERPEGEEPDPWKEEEDTGKGKGPEGEPKKEEAEPGEALIVYILSVILIVGGICREIKKMSGIPYTPMLLVFGILLGTYAHLLGDIGHAFWMLLQINPHGILMIFIPTIIFESAYNSDPFTIKRQLWQILLLAGPGVVIGAILITIGFNYGLGYSDELSIAGGLTFGAITCATDPVAVVALLKEMGTPLKFNMLLEGESLLNDGTAMVFYMVFSAIYKAKGVTFLGIILDFLQLSLGGVLLGAFACWIAIMWLRRIVKDEILTIAITFMICYVTFFIGETYLKVSGILAIVALGVLMAMFGKVRINPESEHSVHAVWSFVQYVLETVIFVMTGGYIGYYTIFSGESTITKADWIKMILFYFIMTFARYAMIWILKPLMNLSGYPVSHKDIIVLTYGGLRGAIALCLGLMVYKDEDYSPRFRDLVLFYLTGVITLTVLFNGLTMGWLMDKIEFTPENRLRTKVKRSLIKSLVVTSVRHQQKIQHYRFLRLANWDIINELSGTNDLIKNQIKFSEGAELRNLGYMQEISVEDNLIEIRYRVYRLIKSQFWNRFEQNFCSSSVVSSLNDCVDFCMDSLDNPIWIYEIVADNIISADKLQNLISWRNTLVVGRIARSFLNTYMLQTYEMLSTLIVSLEELIEKKPMIPLAQQYVNMVFAEVAENLNKTELQLTMMSDLFPELIGSVQNKQAAHMLMNAQKDQLQEDFHDGTINDDEFGELTDAINSRISKLDFRGLSWQMKDVNDFSVIAPLFHNLSQTDLMTIKDAHVKNKFPAGTTIYRKGQPINGVYIIIKGLVEEQINPESKSRAGLGAVMNWVNIITQDGLAKSTLVTLSDTVAYFISRNVLEKIFENNSEFEENVYKASLQYLLKIYPPINVSFEVGEEIVLHIQKNCQLISKSTGEILSCEYGGFLVSGEIKLPEDDPNRSPTVYTNPQVIPPLGTRAFKVVKPTKFLRFDESIMDLDDQPEGVRKSIVAHSFNQLGLPSMSGDLKPLGRGSQRNSIQQMVVKEKDIEKLFDEIVRNKFKTLTN